MGHRNARLTLFASGLTVGSIYLDHLEVLVRQEPGQSNTPRSSPFNPDPDDRAELGQPAEQGLIPGEISRKRFHTQQSTVVVVSRDAAR